jgi:CcmD family protein
MGGMFELLFQSQTPDTVSYLVLGYVVIGTVGLGYVVTLIVRWRRLQRELRIVRSLLEEE